MRRHDLDPPLSLSQIRRLACEASTDPRTIVAVAAGRPVRGMAGERARAALVRAGYPVPEPRRPAA